MESWITIEGKGYFISNMKFIIKKRDKYLSIDKVEEKSSIF